MKKILASCFLLISLIGFTQTDSLSVKDQEDLEKGLKMLFDSKISMDIDKTIFTQNEANTYFTEDQKVGIVGMVVPQAYAKMKAKLDEGNKKEGMEVVDKGELIIDGQKVLFMKSLTKNEEQEFIIMIYSKENNADSCIMITSFFEKSKENQFKPLVEKAISSAKLTQ
ncbi:MAG: hypothetical protein JNJ52_09360 [Flavobacterium sp.]|nr:hypothetical protein [Flavobacterium sp.]